MNVVKKPVDCISKQDVRDEIDRIDSALVALFAERHQYVQRMAQLKMDPSEAVAPVRIDEVIDKVRRQAKDTGLDEDQAEMIWRNLIDWNVNFEKGIISARQK